MKCQPITAFTELDGDLGILELSDILDTDAIQSLLDDLHGITGMCTGIADMKGNILASVGWRDICSQFHRAHPETERNCMESDTILSSGVTPGEFKLYRCKNNLWEATSPIVIAGQHLGNIFVGQFFYDDEVVDIEQFRHQARQYGFDEDKYLAAVERVPRYSKKTVEHALGFYTKLAGIISTTSYNNNVLSRANLKYKQTEEALRVSESRLKEAQSIAMLGNFEHDFQKDTQWWSDQTFKILGFPKSDFPPTFETFCKRLSSEDTETLTNLVERAQKYGKGYSMTFRYPTPECNFKYFDVTAQVVFDDQGQPNGLKGIVQDVTERKQFMDSLSQRQKELEALYRISEIALLDESLDLALDKIIQHVSQTCGFPISAIEFYDEASQTMHFAARTDIPLPDGQSKLSVPMDETLSGLVVKTGKPVVETQAMQRTEYNYRTLRQLKVNTFVCVPMTVRNRIVGTLSLASRDILTIDENVVPLATALGNLIAVIVERKQAEASLYKSSQIINESTDAVVTTDLNGTILTCNQAGEKLYGYTVSELLGQNIAITYPPEELDKLETIIDDLVQDKKIPNIEITIQQKDGTLLPVTMALSPLKDSQGDIIELMGIARDIREQKHAEEQIAEKERNLQEAQRLGKIGNWEFDIESGQITWSDQVYRLFERDPEFGPPGYEENMAYYHPEDSQRLQQQVQTAIEQGIVITDDYQLKLPSGKTVWHQSNINPLKNDSGKVVKLYGIVQDITQRKQNENQLRMLNQAIENSMSAFNIVDHKGKFVYVNKAYVEMSGYESAEEIIGTSPTSHCVDPSMPQRVISELKKHGKYTFEHKAKRKDGSVYDVMMYARLDYDQEGNEIYPTTSLDVTDQNRIRQELQESEERFKIAMEATKDGLYDWNLETNEIYYSPGWKRMLGYEDQELENDFTTWERLTDPEDVKRAWKIQNDMINKKRNRFEIDFKMRHKDGHWVDILSRSNAVFDDSGKAIRIVGTHVNISERKQYETKLKQLIEDQKVLLDNDPSFIIYKDTQNNILRISNTVAEMTGLPKEDIEGKPSKEIYPDMADRYFEDDLEVMKSGTPKLGIIEPLPTIEGETKWLMTNKVPVKDDDGQTTGIIVFSTDITNLKKTEERLVNYNTFLDSVMEQSPFAMWVADPTGLVIKTNRSLRQTLHLEDEIIVGQYNVLEDTNLMEQGVMDQIKAVFEQQQPTHLVIFWEASKAGDVDFAGGRNLWIDVSMFPIVDTQGNLTNVVCQWIDITEKKKSEKLLMDYQQQLKSLTSQLTLTEENFKKHIAMKLHDGLCQELVMLRVNAGMMARDAEDEESQTSLKKMYDVVGDLIDETKALTTNLSYPELHLHGFEKAVISWGKTEIQRKHGISVSIQSDEKPKPLSEDVKVVLFRGVRELLMNVVKHAQADNVKIRINRIDDNIVVKIKDNGKGFDISESFENKGYSFGLLSVSETLDRLGGHLEYESESESGHGCMAQMIAPLDLECPKTTDQLGESV